MSRSCLHPTNVVFHLPEEQEALSPSPAVPTSISLYTFTVWPLTSEAILQKQEVQASSGGSFYVLRPHWIWSSVFKTDQRRRSRLMLQPHRSLVCDRRAERPLQDVAFQPGITGTRLLQLRSTLRTLLVCVWFAVGVLQVWVGGVISSVVFVFVCDQKLLLIFRREPERLVLRLPVSSWRSGCRRATLQAPRPTGEPKLWPEVVSQLCTQPGQSQPAP